MQTGHELLITKDTKQTDRDNKECTSLKAPQLVTKGIPITNLVEMGKENVE